MVIVFMVKRRRSSLGIFGKAVRFKKEIFFLPLLKLNRTVPLLRENANSMHNYIALAILISASLV